MKKLIFSAVCGLQSLSLLAEIRPEAGSFGLQAEFLYLQPSVDDLFYVTTGQAVSSPVPSKKRNNDFDFTPGFRVEGTYGFCDNSALIVRYARLRATPTDTQDDYIGPVREHFTLSSALGTATSSLDLLYQNVDVLYGFGLWNSCKFHLDLQAGLEYAYVRLNEQYSYIENFGTAVQVFVDENNLHEKTWGIGPQVGMAFNWDLYDFTCSSPGKLAFLARASTSLLVSETTFNEQASIISDFLSIRSFLM